MQVLGLNHINIVTGDLDATVRFYDDLFGMKAKTNPFATPSFDGRWICDAGGSPIVHVQVFNPDRHGELNTGLKGALDHVALTCSGFAQTQQRCDELGIAYRVNDRQVADLRQIFVTDPNGVALELNFPGE
jgi:catechol 2,3-dioxygenase-like lactoylglutathione lyase family enzyme